MRKKSTKKLSLTPETLTRLDGSALREAGGGEEDPGAPMFIVSVNFRCADTRCPKSTTP